MIVENILKYVEKNDTNISDFAKKCGLRPTTVFSIVNGKTKNPTLEVLMKLANTMNMTLDELTKNEKKEIDEAKKIYNKMKNLKEKEKTIIFAVMQTMIENFEIK